VFTVSTSTASTVWDSLREEREYRSAVGLLKSEDYELARRQYKRYLEQFPESDRRSRAYFGLAETYYLQDHYDSAADLYLQALQKLDENEEYRRQSLNRGFHSLNESTRTDLVDDYMKHVERYDGDLPEELGRRIVRALDAAGRTGSAYEQARRYLEENPESPYWRYQLGVLSAERDAGDTAMDYLRPLLQTDSAYQNDARYALAELLYERGDYEQAGQYYQTLLVDDQYRHRARYGLAWVDIQKGNMAKARDRLGTLADGESTVRVQAARDLARIHRSEGKTEKARSWYQQAIDWAAGSRQSRLRLEYGNFLVESDRLTDAIPHFEQADSLEDEARRSLIRAYLVDGQYEEGVRRLLERRNQGDLTDPIWSVRLATAL
jgi:tetratricopeptide (TPR) repeat protein